MNDHLNRLFFFRPTFRLTTQFTPRSTAAWGQFVYDLGLRVQFYHGPRPDQLTAFSPHPIEVAPSRRPYREGRTTGGAYGAIIVHVNYEHTYRGNPGDAAGAGMTARFNAGIRVRPLIPRRSALNSRRLWLKVWMTPRVEGLRSSAVFAQMARNLEFSGSTLS